MRSISFDNKNISVTMNYQDLQRMMKECVTTTMREKKKKKKKKEKQK